MHKMFGSSNLTTVITVKVGHAHAHPTGAFHLPTYQILLDRVKAAAVRVTNDEKMD